MPDSPARPRRGRAHNRRPPNEWHPHTTPPGPKETTLAIVLPALGAAAGIAALWFHIVPGLGRGHLIFAGSYLSPGIGMELAVPIAIGSGLSAWSLVCVVAWFDAWFTYAWVVNLDHLSRWRRTRELRARAERRAHRAFERHPFLERGALGGVWLFIFLPLPATGTVVGSVLAKLMGYDRFPIWVVSILGTGARVAALAFLSLGVAAIWPF